MTRHYYVYILRCADGTYYTGVTNNLDRRFAEHQSGLHKDSYTYSRRPVELKWFAQFNNVHTAIAKEKQIKKWSQAKKEALINDDWDSVQRLAKKIFKRE